MDDVPVLADGCSSPLAPIGKTGLPAVTRIIDVYPEWPPARQIYPTCLQFVIYLAHFALGRNWELYRISSCFAAASVPAVAFLSRERRWGFAPDYVVAAALVVLSPPGPDCWRTGLGNAHEPHHSAGSLRFLAVVARRGFLCLMLLLRRC
jgi:hypothetical protein